MTIMTITELKNFLDILPEEFNDYGVVNGEVGKINEDDPDDYHYRIDKPILSIIVDEKTKELCLLHQSEEEYKEIAE